MATAMDYIKLLPKTNCKECGQATCLAFAMQLANGKAKMDSCPYISDEAKAKMNESSAEPVRTVTVGNIKMGGETVLYRHERRFVNPIAYAVAVPDDSEVKKRIGEIKKIRFDRVGTVFEIDMISIRNDSGDRTKFVSALRESLSEWKGAIILECTDRDTLTEALSLCRERKPLIYALDQSNIDALAPVVKGLPVAIRGNDVEEVAEFAVRAKELGLDDLVLDLGSKNTKECLERNTIARRSALKKKYRPLGYPIVNKVGSGEYAVVTAVISTMKYGSLVIFDELKNYEALPLFTLRNNIYTDPQVPIQVKQDLYPINNPDNRSPIMFTTNFSLTYFTVRADIEKSRLPVWLQIVNTEGLSVLTAYAAGKFDPEHVKKAFDESDVLSKSDGVVIVPGLTARMADRLSAMIERKTIVGTTKSKDIPKHLSSLKVQ